MDWKDTVVEFSHHEVIFLSEKEKDRLQRIREHQAEISFKAGYAAHEKELEKTLTFIGDVCLEHHKAGIKEVVDFVEDTYNMGSEWQAKLKEWGIDGS